MSLDENGDEASGPSGDANFGVALDDIAFRRARLNANGRLIVFESEAPLTNGDANGPSVFLRDLDTGGLQRLYDNNICGNDSNSLRISPDIAACRERAIFCTVTDYVTFDPNQTYDCLSSGYVAPFEGEPRADWPAISANGERAAVGYFEDAGLYFVLPYVVIYDVKSGDFDWIHRDDPNEPVWQSIDQPNISGNGNYVAFHDWSPLTNGTDQVRAWDVANENAIVVSVNSSGQWANQGCANYWGDDISISYTGRFVAFTTSANNLGTLDPNTPNYTEHVYVHDRDADEDGVFDESGAISTVLVSKNSAGQVGNGYSFNPSISADGRFVAFTSYATNLASGESSLSADVFVHDRDVDNDGVFDETGQIATALVSRSIGEPEGLDKWASVISADGRTIVFSSKASNLVADDENGVSDVFVADAHSACVADVDADGDTDVQDLGYVIGAYGDCVGDEGYEPRFDLNANGCVDAADLAAALSDYGCPKN